MKKTTVINIALLIALLTGFQNITAGGICRDFECTSVTITNITTTTYSYIDYNFTIKNVGSDTVYIGDIVVQNYVITDSALTPVDGKVAGGAYISHLSTAFILPGETYSGYQAANSNYPIASYPYLLCDFFSNAGSDCNTTNNKVITKIELTPTGNKIVKNSEGLIQWNSKLKSLEVTDIEANNSFSIYNVSGNLILSGKLTATKTSFGLSKGVYVLYVQNGKQKIVKRIIAE